MKKEHYAFIVDKFSLTRFCLFNAALSPADELVNVEKLHIRDRGLTFSIVYRDRDSNGAFLSLANNIPTQELAEKILQCIRDTEILFL